MTSDPVTITARASNTATVHKELLGSSVPLDQNVTYRIRVRNEDRVGSLNLNDVEIVDTLPAGAVFVAATGGLSDPIDVFYKTNLNGTWSALPRNPYSGDSSSWVDVSSLGLGGSEYITEVKWEFGTIPVGYRIHDTQVRTTVMTTDRNGNPVVDGQEIRNDGGLVYTDYRGTITDDDDDDLDIRSPRPVVRLSKGASPSTVDDGGQTTYTVTLKNDGLAARDLENPVLADLLDAKLVYVPGSYQVVSKPASAPDPVFTVTPDYLGTGRTHLEWAWTGGSGCGGNVSYPR